MQISHAGAKLYDSLGGGGVNVYTEGGLFMDDSLIRASSGCGVFVAANVTTDFSSPEYRNAFLDLTGANQCTQR